MVATVFNSSICTCLTGCDTTSGFFKLGKRTGYTILRKHQDNLMGQQNFNMKIRRLG